MTDTDQPTRDRVRAGDILLSRGWGLPTATVETKVEDLRDREPSPRIGMRELWAKYGTPSSELLERYHRRKAKEEAEAEEAAKDGTDEPAAAAPK